MNRDKLQTICLKCNKKFSLDLWNVHIEHAKYYEEGEDVIIECPHCEKKYRY